MAKFNANTFKRQLQQIERKAQQQYKREVNKINEQNRQAVSKINREINAYNRKADSYNKKAIAELNRQLRTSASKIHYSEAELRLADRVQQAIPALDDREYDAFLSYARIDGSEVASELRSQLNALGVAVWFDEISITPGKSQSLQMDAGLRKARSGITLLTPAYLTGRFWTERELGALLNKETLIPVLHNVTFDDVREYSGILPDLAGFTTQFDSIEDIANKIAAAIMPSDNTQGR